MNTRLIICLALLVAVASAFSLPRHTSLLRQARANGETCPIYKCAKLGETCSISATEVTICTGNSSCVGGLSGTCTATPALKTLDAACSDDDECYSDNCINSKCNQGYEPGTPCVSGNQCVYHINTTYVTQCTSGRCAGLGAGAYCQGDSQCSPPLSCGPNSTCIQAQAAGSACNDDDNCVSSAYCNDDGTCHARIALGAACDGDEESACLGTGLCAPTNADGSQRKCVEAFSQAVGAFCDDDYQCGSGQNCSYSTNGVGKCQNVKSSYKSCDFNAGTGCDAGETCECNRGDGKGVCITPGFGNPSGVKGIFDKAYTCAEQCQRADTPCIADKCNKQICKFSQALYKTFITPIEKTVPSCAFSSGGLGDLSPFEGYGYKCSSASMVHLSAVLALLAIAALAL